MPTKLTAPRTAAAAADDEALIPLFPSLSPPFFCTCRREAARAAGCGYGDVKAYPPEKKGDLD